MVIFNENFKSYFAGFFEGNGSFVIPEKQRDNEDRLLYAKIIITFDLKDKPLAECFCSHYGGHFEEHGALVFWNITKTDQILAICSDINGFLRTPRIETFSKFIGFLKTQDTSIAFEVLPLDESSIGSNAWLSGYSDAKCSFKLNTYERKGGKKGVQITFMIEVKDYSYMIMVLNSENCSTYTPICNTIAEFFDLGIFHRVRLRKYYLIVISATAVKKNAKVIGYFEKYPLFSSKYLDYVDWREIHGMQEEKEHTTLDGFQYCKEIKENFNKKRTTFSWDHLNNFYLKVNEK